MSEKTQGRPYLHDEIWPELANTGDGYSGPYGPVRGAEGWRELLAVVSRNRGAARTRNRTAEEHGGKYTGLNPMLASGDTYDEGPGKSYHADEGRVRRRQHRILRVVIPVHLRDAAGERHGGGCSDRFSILVNMRGAEVMMNTAGGGPESLEVVVVAGCRDCLGLAGASIGLETCVRKQGRENVGTCVLRAPAAKCWSLQTRFT